MEMSFYRSIVLPERLFRESLNWGTACDEEPSQEEKPGKEFMAGDAISNRSASGVPIFAKTKTPRNPQGQS